MDQEMGLSQRTMSSCSLWRIVKFQAVLQYLNSEYKSVVRRVFVRVYEARIYQLGLETIHLTHHYNYANLHGKYRANHHERYRFCQS